MGTKTKKWVRVAVVVLVFMLAQSAAGLITGEHGNHPVIDRGWPGGSLELANLSSRLGYWEGPPFGGGEHHFLYRCRDSNEFNEALERFAAIDAATLELVVHNGPEYSFWLKDNDEELEEQENRVDWTFTVWNPKSWDSLYNNPNSLFTSSQPEFGRPVAAPKIDLYIGGGAVVWEDVEVPANVVLSDKRPGSISAEFAGAGLVRSRVFDMATGSPIVGAKVLLKDRMGSDEPQEPIEGETDKEGFCQIAGIGPGYYRVSVAAPGYASRKVGDYDNRRPEYYEFQVGLAQAKCIGGRVTDGDGDPIEGVEVSACNVIGADGFGYPSDKEGSARTDEQGRFEICDLPTGSTNIRCRAESLYLEGWVFDVYPIPSDSIKLMMTATARITGRVVDGDGKTRSGRINLYVESAGGVRIGKWGWSGLINEDGTFDIKGVPPGEYMVGTGVYIPDGLPANGQLLRVEAGKEYELEIVDVER